MTELLHMKDCYLKEFTAKVIESDDKAVVLDRTAFYPEGGGQPSDKGTLTFDGKEVSISRVAREGGKVKHYVSEPIPAGTEVKGAIDWEGRYSFMRMHTAQHLFSAIVLDHTNAETVGNQIRKEKSRIDFKPFKPEEGELEKYVEEFNKKVEDNIPIRIYNKHREEVLREIDERRRRLFDRIPSSITDIRVIEIEGIDKCPCGGTHVKSTKEIGRMRILSTENKGSETVRVTFTLE